MSRAVLESLFRNVRGIQERPDKRTIPFSIFYPGREGQVPAHYSDLFEPAVEPALSILLRPAQLSEEKKRALIEASRSLAFRSYPGVPVEPGGGPYPVLIYSPGGGGHRFSNVPLFEELVKRGYVVVSMDHPFETPVTVLPDGTICEDPPADDDFIALTLERIRDTKAVLDELETLSEIYHLDLSRIGMFGASRGGYVSILTQAEEPRIKAVGNLDGFLYAYYTNDGTTGIERWPAATQANLRRSTVPILRICGDGDKIEEQFQTESKDIAGDFFLIRLRGWAHGDFATSPVFGKLEEESFLRLPPELYRNALAELIGEFFDLYFRKGTRELLRDGFAENFGATIRCRVNAANKR